VAKNVIGSSPFVVQTIDTDEPLVESQIKKALGTKRGVSLCVRAAKGPHKRGGYFFHIRRSTNNSVTILDFENRDVVELTFEELARFVNHASGREFDDDMFQLCQSVINYRQDQKDNE
jgi:hypothetical protein